MATLLGFLLPAALLLTSCGHPGQNLAAAHTAEPSPASDHVALAPRPEQLERIKVAPASLERFAVDEVLAPGKLELNPHRLARVLMPVAGRVRQVLVRLGDPVAEGQTLLTIDSPEAGAAAAAYRQAQARLREAQSTLGKAEADRDRVRELLERGAIARKELLTAQHDVAQAQSGLEQAQAVLDEARHRLAVLGLDPQRPAEELAVRAPFQGKVIEIAVVPGEYRNDTAASLMTLADLRTIWVAADVPETAIRLVDRGERIQIELYAYPGEVFSGRVMRIADSVDAQSRTVKVQAEIPNPAGRLLPEMFGQIRHTHGLQQFPAVPAAAVLQRSGSSVVFLEETRGVFREAPVAVGTPRNGLMPVLSGLKAGDRVVVDGAVLLRKGPA